MKFFQGFQAATEGKTQSLLGTLHQACEKSLGPLSGLFEDSHGSAYTCISTAPSNLCTNTFKGLVLAFEAPLWELIGALELEGAAMARVRLKAVRRDLAIPSFKGPYRLLGASRGTSEPGSRRALLGVHRSPLLGSV